MRLWIALLALSVSAASVAAPMKHQDPDLVRRGQLEHLLRHDCGSCHGLTRQGGLGPPLLPADLAGKPASYLMQTILDGRPGTAMPPWRSVLSESDIRWLVDQLMKEDGP